MLVQGRRYKHHSGQAAALLALLDANAGGMPPAPPVAAADEEETSLWARRALQVAARVPACQNSARHLPAIAWIKCSWTDARLQRALRSGLPPVWRMSVPCLDKGALCPNRGLAASLTMIRTAWPCTLRKLHGPSQAR